MPTEVKGQEKLKLKDLTGVHFINVHGPPNSGKGTQSGIICPGISSGDLVRQAIVDETALFYPVIFPQATNSEKGGFIQDDSISDLVRWYMINLARNIVTESELRIHLEGFPRTVNQWNYERDFLEFLRSRGMSIREDHIVYPLAPAECINRSQLRYHNALHAQEKALAEGRIPDTKLNEIPRRDDLEIRSRLDLYERATVPTIMAIAGDISGLGGSLFKELVSGDYTLLARLGRMSFIGNCSKRAIHFVDPVRPIEEVAELTQQALSWS